MTVQEAIQAARAHAQAGRFDAAIDAFRQIALRMPQLVVVWYELAMALRARGDLAEAIAALQRAASLDPASDVLQHNLGVLHQEVGDNPAAIAAFRRAIQLNPQNAGAQNNLGAILSEQGELDEALAVLRRAVDLAPTMASAHNNLAQVLQSLGFFDEAIAGFRRAAELDPTFDAADSNICFAAHFQTDDPAEILRVHRQWNARHAAPLKHFILPHDNDRTPDRRLRIGYVSPDFRHHALSAFMLPLLRSHDRSGFEIFCYSNNPRAADAVTESIRAGADAWRDIFNQTDDAVAAQIRADRIDILVDLTMHSAYHRLLVFARKPAPVQVTYLAYCGTTGLDAIDYRLTDPFIDPPDNPSAAGDEFYSERSIRLPHSYWCYTAPQHAPALSDPPVMQNGHITFGCLNAYAKLTPPTRAVWIKLMRALPQSKLILHSPGGSFQSRLVDEFTAGGIEPSRLKLFSRIPIDEYFALYNQIDIALDPFPYGGGTTSCDALWMGAPLVTLRGRTAVGRGGASILSNLDLRDLVAENVDQYIQIATNLANDRPRLIELRKTLRARMQSSPLMDAVTFARDVEAAFRQIWREWCGKSP